MAEFKTAQFIMEQGLRDSAQSGQHNFINKLVEVLQANQFEPDFSGTTSSPHSLTHMKPPLSSHGLTFRRVYHYPFWQIDASDKRWEWDVAQTRFNPNLVDPKESTRFYNFWRKRLFPNANAPVNDGFIYLPLQGRLLDHRSFQSCSPIEMIERTLDTFPNRQIIATLHPNETYTSNELNAVERLEKSNSNLDIKSGQMEVFLTSCACVITQNSSAAFNGYFFGKPAVLFGKIDFHHIALNGTTLQGFDEIAEHTPDYARYIHWFWQEQSINAGHPTATVKIHDRLKKFGWIT